MSSTPLITDEQTLKSATGRFGLSIPVYDDGFGPLWIHRDSMGISGIIRAASWEDAYSIAEDEFFPEAEETEADFVAEYGEDFLEDACWQEAFGFRPNGGVYQKDLNGDSLDLLTPAMVEDWEISLEIESPVEEEEPVQWHHWHTSRRRNANGRQVFSMFGRYSPHASIPPNFVSRRFIPVHSTY
jgi:hypothetical protein